MASRCHTHKNKIGKSWADLKQKIYIFLKKIIN